MSPWHSDYTDKKVRTEIIVHEKVDPRMRVKPNPVEVERAARLLVEAERPLLIVGAELYKTRSIDKAVQLAELLGMAVTQTRQVFADFPQDHPLWLGSRALSTQKPDAVINVGNKLQHGGSSPLVTRHVKFVDMRIDSASMGNVITTDVPLVADVAYGMEDLMSAIQDITTPSIKKKVLERAEKVHAASAKMRQFRPVMTKNPDWNQNPLLSDLQGNGTPGKSVLYFVRGDDCWAREPQSNFKGYLS